MMRAPILLLLIGGLACFVGGTLAGAWLAGPVRQPPATLFAVPHHPPVMKPLDGSPRPSRRLAHYRERTTEARRWDTLPVSQFPHELEMLARGFGKHPSIQPLLRQWAQRDADGYAAYVVRCGHQLPVELGTAEVHLVGTLLDTLIPRDPADAIAVLKDCPDLHGAALWSCAESWRKKFPDTFPRLLAELGERLALDSPGEGWWRSQDPLSLLPLLQQLPSGPSTRTLAADGVTYFLENPSADLAQAASWWQQLSSEYQAAAAEAFRNSSKAAGLADRTHALSIALGQTAPEPPENTPGHGR